MEDADFETMVRKSDRTEVPAEHIRPEDQIMSEGNELATVLFVSEAGTTKFKFIKTEDNHSITVEFEQPFVAENKGLTQAQDLTLEDRILTEDGKYTKITAIDDKDYGLYNQSFYLIETKNNRNYIGNGLVLGDSTTLMNLASKKRGGNNSLSAEDQARLDEIRRMAEKLGFK